MASYSSHVDRYKCFLNTPIVVIRFLTCMCRYIETLEQCKLLTDTQVQDLCKQAKYVVCVLISLVCMFVVVIVLGGYSVRNLTSWSYALLLMSVIHCVTLA